MKSTTRFKKNEKGLVCKNCTQPLDGLDNFCSYCGQVNDTKKLSIKQFIKELLGGFFAFDTRSLKTLYPLLIKPGKVTGEYINGKRMKYVNPFQLYLHTSILFFLVTGIFSSIDDYNDLAINSNTDTKKKDSITNESSDLKIDTDGFHFNLSSTKVKDTVTQNKANSKDVNQKIKEKSKKLIQNKELLNTLENTNLSSKEKNQKIKELVSSEIGALYGLLLLKNNRLEYEELQENFLNHFQQDIDKQKLNLYIDKSIYIENNSDIATSPSSGFKKYSSFIKSKTENVMEGLDSLGYEKTRKNIFLYKKLQGIHQLKNEEDLNGFFKKSISKLSIILFFMLPLFTLFVSLVYIRNRYNYTENLIFVFNVQTVFFIFLLAAIILDRVLKTDMGVNGIFPLGFLWYLYKAMRNFYKQTRTKTIMKFIFLNLVFLILSAFSVLVVISLAVIF